MFKVMLEELRALGIPFETISTARQTQEESENWSLNWRLAVRVLFATVRMARRSDVVTFHASLRAATLFGPLLALVSFLLRRPFVLRLFGGAFDREYEQYSHLHRWWFSAGCRLTGALLVETKMLHEYTRRRLPVHIVFFPNYTQIFDEHKMDDSVLCRRFIFAGRVIPEKGIGEIVEAARQLQESTEVDIYGPIDPSAAALLSPNNLPSNVRYRGNRPFAEIKQLMTEYHAQLLPSYYEGEGYPSAVLEGFAAGLPLVGSTWRALPELVTNDCGILVKPRNTVMLIEAMHLLCTNPILYRRLREGARRQVHQFSSKELVRQFCAICSSVSEATQH